LKRFPVFVSMEILISLSILILLLGIQIPTFSTYWQFRDLEIQANQLLQDIELVRSLAIEKREKLKMEFYGTNNYYRFETDQDGFGKIGTSKIRKFTQVSGFPYFFRIPPFSYTDEAGTLVGGFINFGGIVMDSYGVLSFNSSGVPSSGGHIVIVSKNLDKGLVVIIKPVTGRARIGRVFLHFNPSYTAVPFFYYNMMV
jgi:hypothetical protein